MASPGPGNGWRLTKADGHAQLAPERADLVLEQFAQRLQQFEPHALGQSADIMMRLDGGRRPAGRRHALDHVGIERALRQEFDVADLVGLRLEHVDEQFADHLALDFGVGDALQRVEEPRRRIDRDQRNVVMAAEQLLDLLRLALAQQAVIDEDAGELVADRLVDQERRDGRIDPARQSADHPPVAHFRADAVDLAGAELRHGPVAGAAGNGLHEIGEQRRAFRRVHHFGVKLHAVQPPRIVGDGRERRPGRDAHGAEAGRQPRDAVAMAHPYPCPLADLKHAVEQRRIVDDLQLGPAELSGMPALDHAAERRHHGLLAIADAEHRHAGIEQCCRGLRCARLVHRGRAARQDDGLGRNGLAAPLPPGRTARSPNRRPPRAPAWRSAGCIAPRNRRSAPGRARARPLARRRPQGSPANCGASFIMAGGYSSVFESAMTSPKLAYAKPVVTGAKA